MTTSNNDLTVPSSILKSFCKQHLRNFADWAQNFLWKRLLCIIFGPAPEALSFAVVRCVIFGPRKVEPNHQQSARKRRIWSQAMLAIQKGVGAESCAQSNGTCRNGWNALHPRSKANFLEKVFVPKQWNIDAVAFPVKKLRMSGKPGNVGGRNQKVAVPDSASKQLKALLRDPFPKNPKRCMPFRHVLKHAWFKKNL